MALYYRFLHLQPGRHVTSWSSRFIRNLACNSRTCNTPSHKLSFPLHSPDLNAGCEENGYVTTDVIEDQNHIEFTGSNVVSLAYPKPEFLDVSRNSLFPGHLVLRGVKTLGKKYFVVSTF